MTNTAGHILVIDDEAPLLKMLSVYLRRLGYQVTAANSTETAWAEFSAAPEQFAVAVMDATMSGMAVKDLASQMMAANERLCVIVASGYPVEMTALEAAAPGRAMFLHKPFTPEMLAGAVRRMLATKEEGI
jgi:DNA-binding NtrC family response regulator